MNLKLHLRKNIFKLIVIIAGFLQCYDTVAQDIPDSKGTDFWLTYMPNFHNNKRSPDNAKKYGDSLYIFITSDEPTTGLIEYWNNSGQRFTSNFSIADVTKIYTFKVSFIDFELLGFNDSGRLGDRGQCETIAPQSFHLTSEKDVTIYAHSQAVYTSEAFIVLPTDALGEEYFILAYNSDGTVYGFDLYEGSTPSQFAIVAVEDSTNVTIEPSSATYVYGMAPQRVSMNRGDVYLVQSKIDENELNRDLSGSHITSNKPIAVFSGHQRSSLPIQPGSGNPSRDILIEQMPPLKSWGKNAILVPYPQPPTVNSEGTDIYRIIAAYDNTDIFYNDDPNPIITLNKAEYVESQLTQPASIRATAPILVTQYKKTSNSDGGINDISDPFMMIIPQVEQFGNFYRCINVQAWDYRENNSFLSKVYDDQWITIVAPNSTLNTVQVDKNNIPVANFKPVPGSNYSYAWVDVSDGTHTVAAEEPIGIYVYGYGVANSYGYFGGMNFRKLDFRPPEIASAGDCYEIQGEVFDSTAGDSHLKSVTSPPSSINVRVQIENFKPYPPKVSFSANLQDIFRDGEFEIVAVDSADLQSRQKFEIPGYTLNIVGADESGRMPLISEDKRISQKYCWNIAIQNYGKFPHQISDSNFSSRSGKFWIETPLPRTIGPSDYDTLQVCFISDAEGIFIDTLSIGDSCAMRKVHAFRIKASGDNDEPKVTVKSDSCSTKFNLAYTDNLVTDFGLKSVEIVDTTNFDVKIEPFDIRSVKIEANVIDPYQDAYFKVIAIDSAGHETVYEKFIPGFTISFGDYEPPNNILAMGNYIIGTIGCDTITLFNYGSTRKVFLNFELFSNMLFSIPASQFPFVIEPGDSNELVVCYHPSGTGDEFYYDTLYIKFGCLTKKISLEGESEGFTLQGQSRCGVPIRLSVGSVSPSYKLLQNYPNPASNTTKARFSIPTSTDVLLSVFDSFGLLRLEIINAKFEPGLYEIEFSIQDLEQGVYYIQMNSAYGKQYMIMTVEK